MPTLNPSGACVAHPICSLHTFYFSFSLPPSLSSRSNSDPGSLSELSFLPPAHYRARASVFNREKTSALYFLVGSRRILRNLRPTSTAACWTLQAPSPASLSARHVRSRTSFSAATIAAPAKMRLRAHAFLFLDHLASPCPRRSTASMRSESRFCPARKIAGFFFFC